MLAEIAGELVDFGPSLADVVTSLVDVGRCRTGFGRSRANLDKSAEVDPIFIDPGPDWPILVAIVPNRFTLDPNSTEFAGFASI